jgi:hypothetical protein
MTDRLISINKIKQHVLDNWQMERHAGTDASGIRAEVWAELNDLLQSDMFDSIPIINWIKYERGNQLKEDIDYLITDGIDVEKCYYWNSEWKLNRCSDIVEHQITHYALINLP